MSSKKVYMSEQQMRVWCALAYFPLYFFPLAVLIIGLNGKSNLIRNHGINGIILMIGSFVGSTIVMPLLFSSGFYIFNPHAFSADTIVSVFSITPNWLGVLFLIYQIYLMYRVYNDIQYVPFFAPFRDIV
jgi:hypothetical protein